MTDTESLDHRQPAVTGIPGDVPVERPSALDRLNVLLGRREVEASLAAGFLGPDEAAVTSRAGPARPPRCSG
jgi:hypothetical protein